MRAAPKTGSACAAAMALVLTAPLAQAQMGGMGGGMGGMGGGMGGARNLGPGQQPDKKPQYVPGSKQQEKIFPLGETWTAVSLNGKPFSGTERPSFIIDSQYRARGYGGCNTFTATAFPLREQHLAVGPLAVTKRACDKGIVTLEQSFLMALRTAAQWDIVGSQLVVKSQNGELRFDRAL